MSENAATPGARKFSAELMELASGLTHHDITLRQVIRRLGQRAYSLLVILLALPFLTPIPLPGVSTPFGIAIGMIALRLVLGRRPWLPKRLQRQRIPPDFLGRVLSLSARLLGWMERFLRPRIGMLVGSEVARRTHAFLILMSACVLLLPLPIPFSNTFPAWAIILTAAGVLERDGLAVIYGWIVFLSGMAYLFLLGEAAQRLAEQAWQCIQGG